MTSLSGASLLAASDVRSQTGIRQPRSAAEAARQFEALLVEQMLKSMREATQSDEHKDSVAGGDTYLEMAEQHLARLLAERGGLGLTGLLERALAGPVSQQAKGSSGSADRENEGKTGQVRP